MARRQTIQGSALFHSLAASHRAVIQCGGPSHGAARAGWRRRLAAWRGGSAAPPGGGPGLRDGARVCERDTPIVRNPPVQRPPIESITPESRPEIFGPRPI